MGIDVFLRPIFGPIVIDEADVALVNGRCCQSARLRCIRNCL
jgi:hypothetical protein